VKTWLASVLPSRTLIGVLGAASAVLIGLRFTSLSPAAIVLVAAALGLALLALLVLDARLSWVSWTRSPLTLTRRLPHAFAVGSAVGVQVSLTNPGPSMRRGRYFELADPTLAMPAMPLRFAIKPGERETFEFNLTPTARGLKFFEAGQLRLRSILGLLDCNLRIGSRESRRVFPDFKRQASLAWLATDRRLAELGIKNVRRRGEGTDFDQLTEYRAGDPVRNIDWKATLKHGRPIARVFQDERDQSVLFLLDCGRRMRADDTQSGIGASHFDQSLDALMLLTFVALASGDAVGAMTFGTAVGQEKRFAPRKGRQTLNQLMAALGDVEPSPIFSDYLEAAAEVMRRQRKRGLIVLVTNCREEDSVELLAALRLLRSRHVVVVANLREQIVGAMAAQPLSRPESIFEVAAALDYEQKRRDMLRRLAAGGAVLIDCEPRSLGVELVKRYTVLKRTGAI
jgi:uncharacterized protein (DUF58 family)